MPTDPTHDKPIPDSQADQALPRVDVPSEGDIDLESLESKAGDPVPPSALPVLHGLPVGDSHSGQGALPVVDVPSEGDINLDSLSRAGDEIPVADLVKLHGGTPVPDSQSGQTALPRLELPSEGDIDLGALQSKHGEEIPLANLPEAPSGQSLTSWTEVIRRQRAAAQTGQASAADVRVDAPSDKDILIRFDEGVGPPRRTGDTSEILPGDLPVYTGPSGRSESDIDLGRIGLGAGTGESEVKFDILYPPSDAAGAMPAPGLPPLSGVDFRAAVKPPSAADIPFAAVVDPASGVNLGEDVGPPSEGGRSSILDALLQDNKSVPPAGGSGSVLNFGSAQLRPAKATVPAAEHPAVPTRPSIDMGGSKGSIPEVSGRDLVDPDPDRGSEEAIDLYAEPAPVPSITDSGTLEISQEALEESQRRSEAQESSSVDLSSRPSYHGSEFDKALEAPSGVAPGSDSDVDLNLPAGGDEGDSSMIHRGSAGVNEEALAAEFKARRQAREREEAKATKKAAARPRREVVPARREPAASGSRGLLIGASVLSLLLGAGGVLAAYFGGVLPDRGKGTAGANTGAGNSAELARLKQDIDVARNDAAAARADIARQVEEAKKAGEDQVRTLTDAKAASDAEVRRLTGDAQKAQADLTAARKAPADAKLAEQAARTSLATATKATDDARKELADATAARKAADDTLAGLTKGLKDAGIDPAKPDEGVKQLLAAKVAAEAKAKDADTRVKEAEAKATELAKKEGDLVKLADAAKKSADDARKAADDAARARDASDATVKAVADRLAKAKFVGDKADAAAILKGVDDAVKAGSSDATASLREELKQARDQEARAKADLTAAREKEAEATKAAQAAKAEAQKATGELARLTAESAKLKQDANESIARAAAAEKAAADARAASERSATEMTRLKVETERLTRDLDAVKELAELIKTPAGQIAGPVTRQDPDRYAEQFYGDGLRAFHRGQTAEAESAFRKALQFRPNDARFHYLLGLTLWARKDTAGAEAEFEKGRDLELAGRPSSRAISAALERIQGAARQAVDAWRP